MSTRGGQNGNTACIAAKTFLGRQAPQGESAK